jgi:hypothetical protein
MPDYNRPRHRLGFACTAGLVLVGAVWGTGCRRGPRAPALQDEPVFHNEAEGFRFLPPEGWKQHARAVLPPGPVTQERALVEYQCATGAKPASLAVSCVDLPESTDLAAHLAGRSFGSEEWQPIAAAEQLDIGGAPAVRMAFAARWGNDDMVKEVTAFRRRERVYFFTGLFTKADAAAREQLHRSVASVVWRS